MQKGLIAALLVALGGSAAHAQSKPAAAATTSLSGTWRAGATAMDVSVESWGSDCGPRPQSSRSDGGGMVTVTQLDKQLTIRSRDSEVRSDACWSQNPAMRRTSSSVVDQVWTTRCKTPANDPREEEGTYTLKVLGPDTLLYRDVSRYNWALKTSKCVATFTTSQTLVRSTASTKAAPAPPVPAQPAHKAATPPPPPPPEAPQRVCTPGAAARIALRPKRATIQVGQRVCLRARVTDQNDCVIPNAPVTWSLEHSKALRGELAGGCFTAASTSAEAEGEFKVIATSLGLRAEGAVQVQSADLSGLIAQRIEGGGLVGLEEAPVPTAEPKAAARISTRSVAAPKSSKGMWVGIGLVLVLAAGATFWVLGRKRSVHPAPENERDYTPMPTATREGPTRATTPEAQPAVVMPKPGIATRPETPAVTEPWICPLCRLGYPAQQKTCSRDGSPLMPYSEFTKRSLETVQTKQKRCPKCGATAQASATFCGNDGTPLVDA